MVDPAKSEVIVGTAARALNGVKGPKIEIEVKARGERVRYIHPASPLNVPLIGDIVCEQDCDLFTATAKRC